MALGAPKSLSPRAIFFFGNGLRPDSGIERKEMHYTVSIEVDDAEVHELDLANNDSVRTACELAIRGVIQCARLQARQFDGHSGNGCLSTGLDAGTFDAPTEADRKECA